MTATAQGLNGAAPIGLDASDPDDWRLARRCQGCGRWLTDPRSVAAGIGPRCAQDRRGRA